MAITDHSSVTMDPELLLDTSGLRCPLPIMRTKQEISKLTKGQLLQIIASDPSYKLDLSVFIRQSGHILLNSWEEGGKFYFRIQIAL